MPQASARRLPFGHPRICSQITGDSALQCWSGCEISPRVHHFYSRPCGRGDVAVTVAPADTVTFLLTPLREGRHAVIDIALDGDIISTHAPAGGATPAGRSRCRPEASYFYSRPCGRDDENVQHKIRIHHDFYSRPCGRGDHDWPATGDFELLFLLTPLREGRRIVDNNVDVLAEFLLTPLREGRRGRMKRLRLFLLFLLTPLREGRRPCAHHRLRGRRISTHAPAGGATCVSGFG